MMAKKQLATEIVSGLHGDEAAHLAGEAFNKIHQQREMPQNMPEFKMVRPLTIVDLLVETSLCSSKSEAKRVDPTKRCENQRSHYQSI